MAIRDYSYYTRQFKNYNDFDWGEPRVNSDIANAFRTQIRYATTPKPDIDEERGILDRVFDTVMVGVYPIAGAIKGGLDPEQTAWEGFVGGLKASNPFGDGYEKGEVTYSDVLEEAGWKPDSTGGKIMKGTAGFIMDVLLDPTTYLTGGLSNLAKGSGKVASNATKADDVLKEIAEREGFDLSRGLEGVNKQIYDNAIQSAQARGLTVDKAVQEAFKQIDDVSMEIASRSTHVDNIVAESLIRRDALERGITLSSDELANQVEKFVSTYNKVRGINREAVDVTFGLGNLPFMSKRFGVKKLSDGKTLQKIGDVTLAPLYNKIRAGIYGSKIGELFSTTSALYKLSKRNPAELYDVIKFAEHTRGLKGKQLKNEAEIRKFAEGLKGLTPAETKEIIEALENPAMFNKIRKVTKLSESAEYGNVVKSLEAERDRFVRELEEAKRMADEKKNFLGNVDMRRGNLEDVIKQYEANYRQRISELDINQARTVEEMEEVIKLKEEALKALDNEDVTNQPKVIVDTYKEFLEQIGKKNEFHQRKSEINRLELEYDALGSEKRKIEEAMRQVEEAVDLDDVAKESVLKDYQSSLDEVEHQLREMSKKLPATSKHVQQRIKELIKEIEASEFQLSSNTRKASKEKVEENLTKLRQELEELEAMTFESKLTLDDAPSLEAKTKLVNEINDYLFDGEKILSPNATSEMQRIVGMIDAGWSKEKILEYVRQNYDMVSGKTNFINSFVAQILDYQYWRRSNPNQELGMGDVLDRLQKRFRRGEKLSTGELNTMNRLQNLANQRAELRELLMKQPDLDSVKKVARELYNQKLSREIDDIYDQLYNPKFGRSEMDETRDAFLEDTRKPNGQEWVDTDYYVKPDDDNIILDDMQRMRLGKDGEIIETHPNQFKSDVNKNVEKSWQEDATPRPKTNQYARGNDVVDGLQAFKTLQSTYDMQEIQKDVMAKMVQLLSRRGKKFNLNSPLNKRRILALEYEVSKIMDKKNLRYTDLDEDKRWRALNLAVKRYNKYRKTNRYDALNMEKRFNSKARDMVTKSTDMKRIRQIQRTVRKGTTIRFMKGADVFEGRIERIYRDSNNGIYDVILEDGHVYKVFVDDVIEVLDGGKPSSLGKAIETPTQKTVREISEERETLIKEIEELKQQKQGVIDDTVKAKAEEWQKYIQVKKPVEEQIKILNSRQADYERAVASGADDATITALASKIDNINSILDSEEAIMDYMRAHLNLSSDVDGDMMIASHEMVDALDETDINENNKKIIRMLRKKFDEMGEKEVQIGKLSKEQFNGMLNRYFPHIPTEKGERFLLRNKEVANHHGSITQDLGYGLEFNPHRLSRTIKGKNVYQINEDFAELLKGHNLFSTSLADVYLLRAMKHNDLMYDYDYMNTMMSTFGKRVGKQGVEEGYKAVVNYGQLREEVRQRALARFKAEQSDMASNSVKPFYQNVRKRAVEMAKKEFSDEAKAFIQAEKKRGVKGKVELPDNYQAFKARVDELYEQILETEGRPELPKIPDEEMHATLNLYVQEELKKLGLSPNILDEYATPMIELSESQVKRFQQNLPKVLYQVNDVIVQKANSARKVVIDRDHNALLKMYDKFLHWVKLNQTTVMPAFHVRNFMANVFNNWLAVGSDALNPHFYKSAVNAIRHRGALDKVHDVLEIPMPNGSVRKMSWSEVYQLAQKYNVIDEGFFAKDIGAGANTTGKFGKYVSKKYDPTDTGNFFLYRLGGKVGNFSENTGRLVHFASQLKNGKSIEEASQSATKYLFDYSDLTPFEMRVMKRVLPYYTWLRKNARLQVSMLIEKPGKYRDIAKFVNGINHMNSEDDRVNDLFLADFAKDWVQTPFFMYNEHGRKEPVLWNPNLPFMDIGRLPDPLNPGRSLLDLFTQSAPMIKIPIELATNKNVFFDDEIVSEGENAVVEGMKYLARQIATYNAFEGTATKEGTDFLLHLLNNVSGVKFLSYDYETFKSMQIQKMKEEPDIFEKIDEAIENTATEALRRFGEAITLGVTHPAGYFGKGGMALGDVKDFNGIRAVDFYGVSDKSINKEAYDVTPQDIENYELKVRQAEARIREEFPEFAGDVKLRWALVKGDNIDYAKVTHVVDGDTIKVIGSDGKEHDVRMLLLNTPEVSDPDIPYAQPLGEEASNFAKEKLSDKNVILFFDGEEEDKYGRKLAYVHVDGEDYVKSAIQEGYGKIGYVDGSEERLQEYFDTQAQAYESGRGIWGIDGYATMRDEPYNPYSEEAQEIIREWLRNRGS